MLEERGPDWLPARAVTDLLGVRRKTVEQAEPAQVAPAAAPGGAFAS
ncbi:hypothetical protein [Streptomyces sp. enrichment culture]